MFGFTRQRSGMSYVVVDGASVDTLERSLCVEVYKESPHAPSRNPLSPPSPPILLLIFSGSFLHCTALHSPLAGSSFLVRRHILAPSRPFSLSVSSPSVLYNAHRAECAPELCSAWCNGVRGCGRNRCRCVAPRSSRQVS